MLHVDHPDLLVKFPSPESLCRPAVCGFVSGGRTWRRTQNLQTHLNPDIVLIPQGAKLVGQYSSRVQYGQKRVLVAWNQLIFPNGAAIGLRGMSGTDGEGQAGFGDLVEITSSESLGVHLC
ncbi:TrbI/VirB10 family protein [Ferrovum sp.]|uniref:TrbI/VirB10 family protein n=1 Tax=Ferrovum sp. TaxID=2609467 RepID=UPI0034525547